MNQKCTLLTAALMVASVFTASAGVAPTQEVKPANWTVGNYYYLQSGDNYLSLDGNKADSVIVKNITFDTANKSSLDSALWEITNAGTETAGIVYQFKNKKTQAILSFAAAENASLNIAPGIAKWAIDATGKISASYGTGKKMTLKITAKDALNPNELILAAEGGADFAILKPDSALVLKANELGAGFQVFQLAFGATYEGDIFSGKDLLASQVGSSEFVRLQVNGDATADGKAKYLGVDTLKTTITGAKGAYGAQFSLDSTRTEKWPNADYQQFKFTIDLMNDSLAIYTKAAPDVEKGTGNITGEARVVVATLAKTNVLTVSAFDKNLVPLQGTAPKTTLKKGTPSSIATGEGVYFLKSASKGANGGKYLTSANGNKLVKSDTIPNIYESTGQWYIKSNNGMYTIVDRKNNTAALRGEEIFAVQGMPNTYTFGGNHDSVTVVYQSTVKLTDRFLGSRYFTATEMADNAYVLSLISGTTGVTNLYAFTSDSVLQVKSGDAADAIALRMEAADTLMVGGAQLLGDTLFQVSYKIKEQFSARYVAYDVTKKVFKLSATTPKSVFKLNAASTGTGYSMVTHDGTKDVSVSMDINTSNLVVGGIAAYFNFVPVAAPVYAKLLPGHKRFTNNGQSLTMNPLSFYAECKAEGQPILKANYEEGNFGLWVDTTSIANGTPGKQLYFISTCTPKTKATA
ncbi:MAG: hypothetical protein RRZ65_07115, partial [Tannerellaceae bacterium]